MASTLAPQPLGSARGLSRPQLDKGRGRTTLIVLLSVLALVGTVAVVWLAFDASGADGGVVSLALAAIPVPFLVAAYLWLDRYEPEPIRFIVAALLWGAVVSTSFAVLVQFVLDRTADLDRSALLAVVALVTEEFAKGLLVVLVLVRRRRQAGLLDGIIYAGLVGVGFAFTENVLYLSNAYGGSLLPDFSGPAAATTVFALRGLVSPFAHPLFTTAIGIGVAVAVITRRRWLRVAAPLIGFVGAVGLHAAWNGSTLLWKGLGFPLVYVGFMVPLFGLAVYVSLRALRGEARVVRAALADGARLGWLHPAEVHWLVRFGDRSAARRYVRKVAGKEAVTALHAYQRTAAELALMHDRVRRDRAPKDGPDRVRAQLQRLHSWRPFVVLPPLQFVPVESGQTERRQDAAARLH